MDPDFPTDQEQVVENIGVVRNHPTELFIGSSKRSPSAPLDLGSVGGNSAVRQSSLSRCGGERS